MKIVLITRMKEREKERAREREREQVNKQNLIYTVEEERDEERRKRNEAVSNNAYTGFKADCV